MSFLSTFHSVPNPIEPYPAFRDRGRGSMVRVGPSLSCPKSGKLVTRRPQLAMAQQTPEGQPQASISVLGFLGGQDTPSFLLCDLGSRPGLCLLPRAGLLCRKKSLLPFPHLPRTFMVVCCRFPALCHALLQLSEGTIGNAILSQ